MATYDEIHEARGEWRQVRFLGPQGTVHTQRMMPRHAAGSVEHVAPAYVDPRFRVGSNTTDPKEETYRFTSADDGMEYFIPPSAVQSIEHPLTPPDEDTDNIIKSRTWDR